MHQAIGPPQVDKGTKVGKAADDPFAYFTFPEILEQPLALLLTPLLLSCRRRKDQATLAPVDLDDLDLQRFAHQIRQLCEPLVLIQTARKPGHLRCRHKAPDLADGDHQPTLVVANRLLFPDIATLKRLLSIRPGLFLPGQE